MTEKEWLEKMKKSSNKELIESLEYCGHDPYYDELYWPIIKEIKRRLRKPNHKVKVMSSQDNNH